MIPDNITNILSKPAEWIDEEIATLRDFFNKDNRARMDGRISRNISKGDR